MKNTLTNEDYRQAGELLNLEPAMVRAVVEVETGGRGGFVEEGKPVILFEGHVFFRRLKLYGLTPSDYMRGNEDILHLEWTRRHYRGGVKEYERLERAKKINREAAMESASWGVFQIMGFNYGLCGCESVEDFVRKMSESAVSQLLLWVEYLKQTGLAKCLQFKKWGLFALRYNGSAYRVNKYDEKLKRAYLKFKEQGL